MCYNVLMAKKPKLSDDLNKELQLETRLTFGKVIWPISSLILAVVIGVYLYGVYQTEKNTLDAGAIKNPSDKIESKPEIDPDEEEEEEAPAETPTPAEPTPAPEPAPAPQYEEYVIVEGDTLGAVASSYGVTLEALLAVNPGVVAENIQIGQKINIPQ